MSFAFTSMVGMVFSAFVQEVNRAFMAMEFQVSPPYIHWELRVQLLSVALKPMALSRSESFQELMRAVKSVTFWVSASFQVGSGEKPDALSLLRSRRLFNGLLALLSPYSAVVTGITAVEIPARR